MLNTPNVSRPSISKIVDLSRLNKVSMGDPDYEDRLLQMYLENATTYFLQIRMAVDQKDFAKMANISNRLNCISEHLGMTSLAKAARQLEKQGMVRRLDHTKGQLSMIEEVLQYLQVLLNETASA